jgi:hypothetical protein
MWRSCVVVWSGIGLQCALLTTAPDPRKAANYSPVPPSACNVSVSIKKRLLQTAAGKFLQPASEEITETSGEGPGGHSASLLLTFIQEHVVRLLTGQ